VDGVVNRVVDKESDFKVEVDIPRGNAGYSGVIVNLNFWINHQQHLSYIMTGGHHHRATLKQVSQIVPMVSLKLMSRTIKVSNPATLPRAPSKPLRKVSYRDPLVDGADRKEKSRHPLHLINPLKTFLQAPKRLGSMPRLKRGN